MELLRKEFKITFVIPISTTGLTLFPAPTWPKDMRPKQTGSFNFSVTLCRCYLLFIYSIQSYLHREVTHSWAPFRWHTLFILLAIPLIAFTVIDAVVAITIRSASGIGWALIIFSTYGPLLHALGVSSNEARQTFTVRKTIVTLATGDSLRIQRTAIIIGTNEHFLAAFADDFPARFTC
jgi:C4-dicarboxylate transporter